MKIETKRHLIVAASIIIIGLGSIGWAEVIPTLSWVLVIPLLAMMFVPNRMWPPVATIIVIAIFAVGMVAGIVKLII
jgi:hypothetical protein